MFLTGFRLKSIVKRNNTAAVPWTPTNTFSPPNIPENNRTIEVVMKNTIVLDIIFSYPQYNPPINYCVLNLTILSKIK